jgi:formate-dependent nitrite reductase membrane component NrfD
MVGLEAVLVTEEGEAEPNSVPELVPTAESETTHLPAAVLGEPRSTLGPVPKTMATLAGAGVGVFTGWYAGGFLCYVALEPFVNTGCMVLALAGAVAGGYSGVLLVERVFPEQEVVPVVSASHSREDVIIPRSTMGPVPKAMVRIAGAVVGVSVGYVSGVALCGNGFSCLEPTPLTLGAAVIGGVSGTIIVNKVLENRATRATQLSIAPYIHDEGSGLVFSGQF